MKFVSGGLNLFEAVTKVSKACSARTTAPIMECIKITALQDRVSLLATDGELSIQKEFKADVLEEGEICVPGKLFSDFISKLSCEEVSLSTGDKGIEIKYRDSVSYMQTLPAEDFPKINLSIGENSVVMKQGDLKQIVAETVFCCAQDDSRPVLKGCKLDFGEKLEAIALDGYRLAISSAEILAKTEAQSIICPARTLIEISRMLPSDEEEITLYTQGGMLLVQSGGMTLVSRLYTGEFIRKESVVPTRFASVVTVNRQNLAASAERAVILNRADKNNLVTFEVRADGVRVRSASDLGNVSETVPATLEGVDITISMNGKFLLDALHALTEDEVVISFNGPVSPFILQNVKEKHNLYLILPVRNIS